MSDFSQNGIISNLHDFGTKTTKEIEDDLLKFSKERKMELILPSLYSELEGDALPNIVREIGNLGDIPLEAVLNVAKELEKKVAFIPETKEFSRGGGRFPGRLVTSQEWPKPNGSVAVLDICCWAEY